MKNETARREIESLDYYLQNHTDDYSEESHTAMMMAIKALGQQLSDSNISDPCDGCRYELNSTNGNPCYSCGKYKLTEQQLSEPRTNLAETSQDCISRQKALDCFEQTNTRQGAKYAIETLPSVTPQFTDEEIDKAQAVEQAYVDKMVELAVEESRREWLNSFDTSSATKCFEAVNILKQRLEGEE